MKIRLAAKCHIHYRLEEAGEKRFAIWSYEEERYISDWLSRDQIIQAFVEEAKKAITPEAKKIAKTMTQRAEKNGCSATASQSKCKDIFWMEIVK